MTQRKSLALTISGDNRTDEEGLNDKSLNRVLMEIVGPALIMLMVGALVFFLIEIFYRGPHSFRLRWVLGLFTFASVLVSRIAVEEGHERASLFALALSLATLFVTVKLVDFEYGSIAVLEPVVVVLFIGVVIWSTNRLTWDCTVIGDSRDVSSIGLTEFVKRKFLERRKSTGRSKSATQNETEPPLNSSETKSSTVAEKLLFLFFANAKNQNTPGLWVFYFALAAFPIFGFGQWFAQPSSGWGYRWIFLLFAVYLGSGLGLLMLTSLLGLERYLKKRGAFLPSNVSQSWMLVGTCFAVGVMLVMLVLPSPSLSTGMENALGFFTTKNNKTSEHAVGKDGQHEGAQPRGQKKENNPNEGQQQKAGNQGDGNGGKGGKSKSDKSGDDSSGKQDSNKQQSSSKNQQNPKNDKSRNQDSTNKNQSSQKNADQNKGPSQEQKNKPDSKNDSANRDRNSDSEQPKKDSSSGENDRDSAEKSDQKDGNQNDLNDEPKTKNDDDKAKQNKADPDQANNRNRQAQNQGQRRQPDQPARQNTSSSLSGVGNFLATVIRYLVYGIGIIVLLVVLWMFRDELAKLWNKLFARKSEQEPPTKQLEAQKHPTKRLPGFAQFQEPFSSGLAATWSASKTIEYTFSALEAWARDHQQPRDRDQTPHEFAKQLKRIDSDISSEAQRLADLLGESLYSGGAVKQSDAFKLQKIWRLLCARRPLQRDVQLVSQS